MQIALNVDAKRTQAVLGRLPSRLEVELDRALRAMGDLHVAKMQNRMRTGSRFGFGAVVRTRSALLERSFTSEVRRDGSLGGLGLRVFSAGVKYANIQEFGGIVRAKKGKFLPIPTDAAKTPSGIARYASPRNYPGKLFFMRDERGRAWLAEKKGKGKNALLSFLWQLVKQVTIAGRLGWFQTWRNAANERRAILNQAVKNAVEKAAEK